MKRFTLAMLAIALLPAPAALAKDKFANLPGVRDPGYLNQKRSIDTVCSSRLVKRWPSGFPRHNGLAERVYSCRSENFFVGSDQAPNMIEYRKFKERY